MSATTTVNTPGGPFDTERTLDPGDLDTPLHALAVPEADRASLKRPETAARELADAIAAALPARLAQTVQAPVSATLEETRA